MRDQHANLTPLTRENPKGRNGMHKKHFAVLVITFAVLTLSALPAMANILTGASATADCSGYTLTVNAKDLGIGTHYTIDYTFTLTCDGTPSTVTGSIPFTATAATATETVTVSWPTSPLSTNCTATGTATLTSSGSTVTIAINGSSSAPLTCGGTGCPATIGFWKNQAKHPFPNFVQQSGLTIGGVHYSAADLLTILNRNGGNAVAILGKQLVGALLNLAAGAKHNTQADAAIQTAGTLLQANNLNLLTSVVDPSTALGQSLLAPASVLDGYNSANFNSCSEGSRLVLGD
jgi:hypothetical protein